MRLRVDPQYARTAGTQKHFSSSESECEEGKDKHQRMRLRADPPYARTPGTQKHFSDSESECEEGNGRTVYGVSAFGGGYDENPQACAAGARVQSTERTATVSEAERVKPPIRHETQGAETEDSMPQSPPRGSSAKVSARSVQAPSVLASCDACFKEIFSDQ
tara:strand:+ start:410 stop:895 length:486 start_codon:yes stop_codon:yes gene_type:complete